MKTILIIVGAIWLSFINIYSQALGDYRSAATGNWNAVGTWQTYNGVAWVAAIATPTSADGVINIQVGHTVTQNIVGLSVDQVVVDGTLKSGTTAATSSFTVANGAGVDLLINGTFWDQFTSGVITWTGTWQFGAVGTLLKTSASASNTWQASYNGGIATIPATSNWVLRKIAAANPVLTTIGGFYGNLTIENNFGGIWNTSVGSTFQGAGGFPTIKGNFDIGGAGASTVNFINQHTNIQPVLVLGNMIVRAGNIYSNFGTGTEIQGNLTNNGTISYDANDGRNLNFTGGAPQSITNTGTLGIFNFGINQAPASTLTLNNPITVDNLATFTSGIVNSSLVNLFIFNTAATVSVLATTTFVNGPVRYLGSSAFTYPVGKVVTYRPIATGIGAPSGGVFWTEAFENSCPSGCFANGSNTGNGAWTVTSTGVNDFDNNPWYISCAENGQAAGVCGAGCGSDESMHIGSNNTVFGDLGASYLAGGLGFWFVRTNLRAESPAIDCTGKSTITLAFNYIENGMGAVDNATLWYFDGVAWAQIADMAKTALCGAQGLWTAFSIVLPASADNNPNVRVGFNWTNNDDNVGTDPSIAVDDITLSTPAIASSFTAEYFPANPQIPYGNILVPTLNTLSNCEYWILSRDIGTDNRTVTLSWNAASCFNTAFASYKVARWDNISGIWQDHNGVVVGTAAGGTVATPAVVTSFSPFAIAFVPIPLPVELIQFKASCDNGLVKVSWQTASETNNDYFLIEKSSDLLDWHQVNRIEGAGNSNTSLSYSYTDPNNSSETYYRLTQFDFDGGAKIYDPISIHCENQNSSVIVYPNPSNGAINISISDKTRLDAVNIYSSLGQLVTNVPMTQVMGKTIVTLDLSFLSQGTYYLRLLVNDHWISKPITIVK